MTNFLRKLPISLISNNKAPLSGTIVRNGHHLRGKPPGIARSLKERLEEINNKTAQSLPRIDIGLPRPLFSRKKVSQERFKILKEHQKDPELEKLARSKQLLINLDDVNKEWLNNNGFITIKEIADHYGIYKDLFGEAYFYPVIPLAVNYDKGNIQYPVYFGNTIKPAEAANKPQMSYTSDKDTFWTLILTNPDGHFTEPNKEYVHWFVANIPSNNIEKGETLYEYLQPFPPRGTGFHRFVFILYKQDKKLNFSKYNQEDQKFNLEKRTFSSLDFYRENQDNLTPTSLSFFLSDWDKSLTNFYHNILEIQEPVFEYDFDPPYIRKEEWFPLRKPFNLYMDKYRDPKQINKEFLERKLKNVHPFKPPKLSLPFPNAVPIDHEVPSWLKLEMRKSRLKWGRIHDIE